MSYLDMALGVKGDQRGQGDLHDLIQEAIQEIDSTYRPGLVSWMKEQPDQWEKMLLLEAKINERALAGDEAGLRVALEEYRGFFKEMVLLYEKGVEMPRFRGR